MKLSLNPAATVPAHVSAEAEALAEWYDAQPTIRRLWAIRDARTLNVILTLEPTVDNGDTSPVWLAFGRTWANEIQALTGGDVLLEQREEPLACEFDVELDGEIVAAISWRDPTSFWKAD